MVLRCASGSRAHIGRCVGWIVGDSLDTLSAATGLSRATMLDIWGEVQANGAKLASCPRHDFQSEDPGRLGAKWRCAACGGHVSANQAHWYNTGRRHG